MVPIRITLPKKRAHDLQADDVRESLPHQPAEKCLFPGLTINFRQRFGKRNFLGARFDAILRVRAVLDPAVPHHRLDALSRVHRTCRMHVKQSHLAENGGAHEVIVLVDLRTNLQAVAAADTSRKGISLFLYFGRDARAFAEIVRAVNRNPRLHPLQTLEHELPVDRQIAHHRKLRQGLDAYRLLQLVHQRGARHARLPVDAHGARTAYLFQAIRIVRHWGGLLAFACDWILRNVAQAYDHVHRRPPGQRKLLPSRGLFRARLPFYLDDDFLAFCHSDLDYRQPASQSLTRHFAASYLRGRGGICEMSTGS